MMSCSAGAHAAPMKGWELLGSVCSTAASWGVLRATELCHPDRDTAGTVQWLCCTTGCA